MSIQFTCPYCGHQTQVDLKYAGKSGPCAGCGQTVSIPWTGENPQEASKAPSRKSATVMFALIVVAASTFCVGLIVVLWMILAPAVGAARGAAVRAQCINNGKRIAMAIDAYHQDTGNYPPAYTVDEKGQPLHSWRVLILPYMGPEETALHNEFDLGLPWDHEMNRRLVNRIPSVYACPADRTASALGETSFCAVEGPGFVFNGSKTVSQSNLLQGDGLSQTLMIVEVVSSNIEWTEPKDINSAQLAQGINSGTPSCCGSNHQGGVIGVFADTTAAFLSDVTTAEELHDMATIQGGELVPTR